MITCPRCGLKGSNIVLNELWKNSGLTFDQNDDGTIERDGYTFDGHPYAVEGACRCGKKWTLRGVIQITNLKGYPED